MMKSILLNQIMFFSLLSILIMLINTIPSYYNLLHPLLLSLLLFLFISLSVINMGMSNNTHWFSYIIFLIMIGGMMIIFLYFTSFISNMNMIMTKSMMISLPLKLFLFIMFSMMVLKNFKYNFPWNNLFNEIISINFIMINNINYINYLYTLSKNWSMLISLMYLLMSLTFIVKMMINKKMSLRKMN
uniref:NADH dehydrogenase subunit 6 n=1 Tax=Anisopteromalus calandrae TaxID=76800 RepID=A0A8E5N7J1_9HYME|nr:NADH dehydrogenase subunit 6 [Anisopteromalus calandrae]QUX32899.1 NADH dehydrogenase subunit 6 [Anisopteromalus calandrae]